MTTRKHFQAVTHSYKIGEQTTFDSAKRFMERGPLAIVGKKMKLCGIAD